MLQKLIRHHFENLFYLSFLTIFFFLQNFYMMRKYSNNLFEKVGQINANVVNVGEKYINYSHQCSKKETLLNFERIFSTRKQYEKIYFSFLSLIGKNNSKQLFSNQCGEKQLFVFVFIMSLRGLKNHIV